MQGRVLTKAEIADVQETMSSDMGPTDVYLLDVVPKLLATVRAMRELLDDADDYTDHSPGCSGWVIQDGKPVYGCKCGFNDWREKLKKLLGEGT